MRSAASWGPLAASLAAACALSACGGSSGGPPPASPSLPPPRFQHSVDIGLVSGVVTVKPPGQRSFVLGGQDRNIPIGSVINTVRGRVDLRAATPPAAGGHRGSFQDAQFYDGSMTVTQQNTSAVTDVNLVGGNSARCSSSLSNQVLRLLWASGSGVFRTSGRYAAATVRGTTWLTEDFCDGTLVRAEQGVVVVQDMVNHRSVTLHAGQSYFARA